MKTAYVDTSCVVALALGERNAAKLTRTLQSYDNLISSNLLEAELRSALKRENIEASPDDLLAGISWVHPDRPLREQFAAVLAAGYVRGADLWHLAVALFVDPGRTIGFLTLDLRQNKIRRQMGFPGL
jgi:PIN domain